jgi:glycosyltransferase involved in cell wall biosynthesis
MRVLATAADDSSGFYRVRLPQAYLDEEDVEVEVVPERRGLALVINRTSGRLVSVELDCDVLVLQRPMFRLMPEVIEHAQAKGIAVVVEIDDDFHTAHPHNRAFQLNHPRVSPDYNWHHLGRCVRLADLVTVSTDQLARRYGGHGRVVVVRNYVDPEILDLKPRGDGRTLGWAGTLTNHPVDLQATRGGVGQALAKHRDWTFFCVGGIGHAQAITKQLELEPVTRFRATAWKPIDLHHLIVSRLDIGIAPLHESAFNAAKSWLKGLEYAALGIPFVASSLPEYERLSALHGIGRLASPRSREWRRQVSALIERSDRDQLGQQWRETVATDLTIQTNAWRWAEAWDEALIQRQRAIRDRPTTTRR